jgi:hypothetical protein
LGYRIKVTDSLLVAFTALLFVATLLLWRSTRGLVKSADQTAQRQLRAYVYVHNVRMLEMNSGYDPNILIIVKNFGQTPARRITNTFRCIPMTRPAAEPQFSLDRAQIVELPDLGPSQRIFSTPSYPASFWVADKPRLIANRRTVHFYVFGRIDYRDIFDQPRWTEYRYRLAIDINGIPNDASLVMDGHAGNRSA